MTSARTLRTSRVEGPAWILAAALAGLVASGCGGEGLPPLPLDISSHDACGSAPPYSVDASASEIQCLVEEYLYVNYADEETTIDEAGANVPGSPVCCEICARNGSADDACQERCKVDLCERAYDEHYAIGQALGTCRGSTCGFSLEACMDTSLLHVQILDIIVDLAPVLVPYGLQTYCSAVATDPARPDGLFRYLEGLDSIPGARGSLAEVDDVVGYCEDRSVSTAGDEAPAATTSGANEGIDSSGTGTDTSGAAHPSEPPRRPRACGPWADDRFWVRPINNFGRWNRDSTGVGLDGDATYPVTVTGGGIAYTMLPCEGPEEAQCVRIDQLSIDMLQPDAGVALSFGLVEESGLFPSSAEGYLEIHRGALRFVVYHEHAGRETLVIAQNDESVRGYVDPRGGLLHLTNITASSHDGAVAVSLSLHADLHNTQPSTEIIGNSGVSGTRVSLTAATFDAEHDPIEHHWMIPGVGSWIGDHLDVEVPIGRHAVILRAVDVHRSQGVAARWITVNPSGA